MIATQETPMVFETVDVAGVALELWTQGSGRPLLYLHPGDGLDFAYPMLTGLAENYRVFAPSHPGFGGSERPSGYTTVDDLAYFYLDFLKQADIADAVVVGVSFGAWIAAEIAIKCTHRIAGLVLADALGVKFDGPMIREIADLFAVPQYDLGKLLYADMRKLDFSALPDETLLRMARNHESFGLFGWSPTLHNPKLKQRLHRIDVPALVLWGAEDLVVSPDYGRRFAREIPDARFELIEGAGHYVHIEQADRFVAAVHGFIAALPPQADPPPP
jgi:pimeloyl-ACP methyl ester carboxylesterase